VKAPRTFLLDERGPVTTLTLNRPEKHNALTFETYEELTECFFLLAQEGRTRCVVITGKGSAFCTGGDVREIIGPLLDRSPAELLEFTRLTCELVRRMRALPAPIVASLNGTVAGAGAAIAVASDLRIACEEARIAFLFVKVGLAGADMGVAHLLPRLVGLGRATELLFTGEFLSAEEARAIGLYTRVVKRAELEGATHALAEALARGPKGGLAATKRALAAEAAMGLDEALEYEARLQADLMREPDFREGYRAFLDRRKPRFEGAPE
jgi:enoyl-CoA hydratase/carnithine racemase